MMRMQNRTIKAPDGFAEVFAGVRETPTLGTKALLEGYEKFPWIRAITDKIGQGIGSTEWKLKAGELEVESHPLLDLLRRPNPAMSGMAFFKWSGTHFALVNEIFWLIERNLVGMPIELWPIPANWVTDIPKMANPAGEYELTFGGKRTKVPFEDMVYIRDFSPANPYGRSSSPAKALGDEIESDEFAAKFVKSYFMNNARPDLLIYSEDKDNPLEKDTALRLEQSWMDKLRGVRKRFRPFFLPGKVGIRELQSNLASMDLVDQRKFWRDISIQVYGIPPEALGIIENSNRATISSAEFFLTKHVIVPRVDIISDSIQLTLAPQFDSRLDVCYVSPVKQDQEHKLAVSQAHPHAFDIDTIRAMAEEEPLPDGLGEIYPYVFNTLFSRTPGGANVDAPPSAAPAVPATPLTEPDEEDTDDEPKALTRLDRIALKMNGPKALPAPLTKAPITDDEIEEILFQMGSAEFNPSVGLANTENVKAFGQTIVDQVSTGVSFDLSSAEVQSFLEYQSGDRITTLINEATKADLRKTLAAGNALGEGADQLATRISDTFEQAKDHRAFRIARTESVRASNFGSLAGMKQMGIKQKRWLAVNDSNTRSSHRAMNGQTISTHNKFTSGNGNQASYPGDFGVAGEDIECRCSILAVVSPEEESISVPTSKDFERERRPYERLIEHAFIKGFTEQEKLVLAAFNLTQEIN